jgi:hypothetical protein
VGNGTLARLLDFPNLETDSPEVIAEKQARLMGNTPPAPSPTAEVSPVKIVPKHLTGRIHPSWKGNDK